MKFKNIFLLLVIVGIALIPLKAQHNEASTIVEAEQSQKVGFQAGDFIIDHISDAYEWHILTYNNFHLSIPLPVILHSNITGWHLFLSSRFHHGHESYRGFVISGKEETKGKIVEVLNDGSIVKPLDLSITKVTFAMMISLVLMLWIFLSVAKKYKQNPNQAPSGLQNAVEPIILFIRDDIAIPSIGEKKYERYMPYLLSIFFFIWINNLMGLIPIFPGGANVTGNITITLVLAVFTFVITTFSGNKHYWLEIFNAPGVPWWLKYPIPLIPIIELTGMFTKPFVLMVRLFANIAAGHIIALGFFCLIFIFGQIQPLVGFGASIVSVAFTIFMALLELLVALIQAYVFTLLSALYFGMATIDNHKKEFVI